MQTQQQQQQLGHGNKKSSVVSPFSRLSVHADENKNPKETLSEGPKQRAQVPPTRDRAEEHLASEGRSVAIGAQAGSGPGASFDVRALRSASRITAGAGHPTVAERCSLLPSATGDGHGGEAGRPLPIGDLANSIRNPVKHEF